MPGLRTTRGTNYFSHWRPHQDRLVGIELNPGPTGKEAAAAIGAALASVISKTRKKPKSEKKKKKSRSITSQNSTPSARGPAASVTSRLVDAPRNVGVLTTSTAKHTPFVMSGRCYGFTLLSDAANFPAFVTNGGVSTSINTFNVDPLGALTFIYDFDGWPFVVFKTAQNFTRYRFKRLRANFVPIVNTGTNGMLVIGVTPECNGNGGTSLVNFGNVASTEVSAGGPVWCPLTLDCLQSGGLRRDWLFCDSNTTAVQAAQRQESAGSFRWSGNGFPPNQPLGQIWWDYEIEFDGIAVESDMALTKGQAKSSLLERRQRPLLTISESSTSSFSSSSSSSGTETHTTSLSPPDLFSPSGTAVEKGKKWVLVADQD